MPPMANRNAIREYATTNEQGAVDRQTGDIKQKTKVRKVREIAATRQAFNEKQY
jgi:hypothetical protein